MSASSEVTHSRIVRLPEGVDLHARPAGILIRAAAKFESTVTLSAGNRSADAKSILQVLALGATGGSELTVTTSGSDSSDALEAIADLLEQLA
jgi:phosphotransferase system HPr (HPr) family protein